MARMRATRAAPPVAAVAVSEAPRIENPDGGPVVCLARFGSVVVKFAGVVVLVVLVVLVVVVVAVVAVVVVVEVMSLGK